MAEELTEARGLRLPHNLEAERTLLGCLILDNRQIDVVLDIFPSAALSQAKPATFGRGRDRQAPPPETLFFSAAHQVIFEALCALFDAGTGVDLTTLAEELMRRGQLETVGGAPYLAGLEDDIFSLGQVPEYARIILQKWRLRCLIRAANSIATEASSSDGAVESILEGAEKRIFEITMENTQKDFVHVLDAVTEQLHEVERRAKGGGDLPGLATGFSKLDQMTTGFRPSNLIILAARPSMGKTAFAMNIAAHVAVRLKKPVGIFSLEMSVNELVQRMLCTQAHVPMGRVRGNIHLRRDEIEALHEAADRIASSPLYVDDASSLSILEMRSRARRLKARCPELSMIVVDYLQLMHGGSAKSQDNRQQEVSEISRSLKGLARELEIPIVALSQLSRQSEQRRGTKDKLPRLSDLRECVTGDTPVMLADGRRVPVASLVGTTPEVIAVDAAGRLLRAQAEAVWSVGRRPVIRLELASGRTLRVTADHRLLGAHGWVRVWDLAPGDRLATARSLPEPCLPEVWTEDRLVLLGHLIGDGSYLVGQPMRYTTASEENSQAVALAASREFGCPVARHAGRGHWHQLVIRGNGNRWRPAGVNGWLRQLGIFGQRSPEKRVPESLFRLSNEQIALFLRHLWATDGCIAPRSRASRGSHRIYFASCSRGLVEDVGSLLLRFGVLTRIRTVRPERGRPVHNLDVSGAENQLRFLERIGAFGPRREPAERLKAILSAIAPNTNVDTLPREVFAEVRLAMRRQGVSQRQMASLRGTSYGGTSHFRFAPSRAVVLGYAALLADEGLERRAKSDLFWDRVVRLESAGEEEVFDLTVPGPHSWLAGEIVSHNSGAIEQDADMVIFIHREKNMQGPDEGPPQPEVATIRIGKQRNGAIGDFEVLFRGEFTEFVDLIHSHD